MKRHHLLSLLLCLLSFGVYLNSLNNGFVNYDDPALVYENRQVSNFNFKSVFTGVVAEDYIPLVVTTFAAEYALFGFDPFYFHLTNVLLNTANVVLIFWFIYLISSGQVFVSLFTSVLFAVHPLHVESVAWVAERKDVLSTFFFLSALILYWRFLAENKKRWLYVMAFFCFALALLAKFMAISLPAILLMMHFYKKHSFRRMLLMQLPFVLVGAVFTYVHLLLHNRGEHLPKDQAHLGAALLRGFDSLAFYIYKMILPHHLSAFYERDVVMVSWREYSMLAIFVLLLVGLAKRNTTVKWSAVFGGLFFLLTIAPVLQIVSFGNKFAFADRFMYLPSIGLFFVIAVAWNEFLELCNFKLQLRNFSRSLLFVILSVLSFLTVERNRAWASSQTLWEDEVAKYPQSSVARNNLGSLYLDQGKYELALSELYAAVKLKPDYVDPHINLGLAYLEMERMADSQRETEEALRLNPNSPRAHLNLGVLFEKLGQLEKAFHHYEAATLLDPELTIARHNLGVIYYRKKELDKALFTFRTTIAIDPKMPETHHNVGVILSETNQNQEAIDSFKRAIALNELYIEPHIQLLQLYQRLKNEELANQEIRAIQDIQARLKSLPKSTLRSRRIR